MSSLYDSRDDNDFADGNAISRRVFQLDSFSKIRSMKNIGLKRNKSVKIKKQFLESVTNLKGCTSENVLKITIGACLFDREDILRNVLHNYHADVNQADENGETAIFSAIRGRSLDCVDILLRENIDIYHRNMKGENVISLAVTTRNFNILDRIMEKIKPGHEILLEVINSVVEVKDALGLSILAEYDPVDLEVVAEKVHFRDKHGHAPLQYAICKCLDKSVKKIILCGCKVSYLKETTNWRNQGASTLDFLMFPMVAGCNVESLVSTSDFNWWLYELTNHTLDVGNEIRSLLEIIKRPQSILKTRYLIFHNYNDREIELIHYVKNIPFSRVFIFNSTMDFLPAFTELKWLLLNRCIFTKVIKLSDYSSLKYLGLIAMNLNTFPECIKTLKNLKFLNISFNKLIKIIPNWISTLPLTHLYLNDNSLTDVPTILPDLLKVLKLHNNKIRVLNPMLSTLKNLIHVTVHGNPLTFPTIPSILNDTELLKKYLAKYLDDTVEIAFTKVAIVGKEQVGKSTLANALMSPKSKADDNTEIIKTDGLDIHSIKLSKQCHIKLFDLAGDIDYFESHVMLLTDDTVYLAVFDLQSYALPFTKHDYFSRVETWLSVIYTKAKNSRVILVGTHADTDAATKEVLENIWKNIYEVILRTRQIHQEKYENDYDEKCLLCNNIMLERNVIGEYFGYVSLTTEKSTKEDTFHINDNKSDNNLYGNCFPHIVGYYEVSNVKSIPRKLLSTTNLSIVQLKEAIENCCIEINKYRTCIPRKWEYIKTAITQKAVENDLPILKLDILEVELVKQINVTVDDFLFCLQYYHSKGELIFFPKTNDNADGIIITDPKWLSVMLCSILSYRDIPQVIQGVIPHESLKTLWNDISEKYFHFLIQVFRKAHIFLQIDDSTELIPSRLPVGRPDSNQWSVTTNENEITFLYQFKFLSPFLFPYLIAEISRSLSRRTYCGMKPVYLGNCIVYITDSIGIPCKYHAKLLNQINVYEAPSDYGNIYGMGLSLSDFSSISQSRDLFNIHRNSTIVTFNETQLSDTVDVSFAENNSFLHRIKFEVLPHHNSIQITVRGSKPCCILPIACGFVANSVSHVYTDLNFDCSLLCPACVKSLSKSPVKFAINKVEKSLPVCSAGHNLESWEKILSGKCNTEFSLSVSNITKAITEFECPKLFILLPVNLQGVDFSEFVTLSYFKEGYAVHLLCEAPNSWHLLKTHGYRVSRPKKFVKTYGRRLRTLINVLLYFEYPTKLASCVFEQLNGITEKFDSLRNIAQTLDVHLSNFSDEWTFLKDESVERQMRFLESNDGLHRRELARFLNKNDEEKRFGELTPCLIQEKVYWLCNHHYKQYSQSD